MPIVFGLFFVALVVVVGAILYWITLNNSLIALRNEVDRGWANIDVLLKQRSDELPKLIKTVETYMGYEQATLKKVIEARSHYVQASSNNDKVAAENEMRGALHGLFALAESYPELKANQQFNQLQERISGLESQLSDRREYYNSVVTNFNTRIQQIPDVWVARMLAYTPQTLFKVTEQERQDVSVDIKLPS